MSEHVAGIKFTKDAPVWHFHEMVRERNTLDGGVRSL